MCYRLKIGYINQRGPMSILGFANYETINICDKVIEHTYYSRIWMYRLRLMTLTLAAGCLLYPCLGEWGRWLTMGEDQPEESGSKNQGFLCTTQQAQLQSSNQFKLIKFHWCDGCAGCAAVYHGQVAVSQQTSHDLQQPLRFARWSKMNIW